MRISVSLCASLCLLLAGHSAQAQATFGNSRRGSELIARIGCGSCHIIPGISGAKGLAGPPLIHMSRRIYIAGLLRNTPENMMRWIMHPQRVVPGNAMPEMGISSADARDIASYLATIK